LVDEDEISRILTQLRIARIPQTDSRAILDADTEIPSGPNNLYCDINTEKSMQGGLWVDKYSPKTFLDLISDDVMLEIFF
jgi:hypothetical protein